jgi:hypothetical protein
MKHLHGLVVKGKEVHVKFHHIKNHFLAIPMGNIGKKLGKKPDIPLAEAEYSAVCCLHNTFSPLDKSKAWGGKPDFGTCYIGASPYVPSGKKSTKMLFFPFH